MATIVGIRFREGGKTYYFAPAAGMQLAKGDYAVVETAHGVECGEVTIGNSEVDDSTVVSPLKPVLRAALPEDIRRVNANREKEKEAMRVCQQKVTSRGLDMKLVDVECSFDGSKILFFFTADGRVDFRDLVRDLASVFHTRIELRQIGVRDEAKMLGGLGICGQPFCCSRFLPDFQPVSIKMAKSQGLSLNPTKISGSCGRLMCCLKYEQDAYEDLIRNTPRQGALVNTPEGRGSVTEVSLLTGKLKVRLEKDPDAAPITVHKDEVTVLAKDNKGGKPEQKKQQNNKQQKNKGEKPQQS